MNQMPSSQPARTGYAPVNGLKIYFEVHGQSRLEVPPLVLLHGGGDTIETSFGHVLPLLIGQRQIIAFEQQGCGRTADIAERPFTFEQSTEDTAALLDYLHVGRADLFGFSNGASIALHVAIRHPQFVRRIIAVTAIMKRDWCYPQFWESMKTATPEAMPQELREAYFKVAPHPENFESFFYKSRNRMRDFQDVPDEAIRAITAPTLVVASDRDVMQPEGAVALYRILPHAQLSILPNTEHMQITSRTDWLVPILEAFLNAPPEPD
jgi:pimeloyl-ACP methyl ester carboxylesterase